MRNLIGPVVLLLLLSCTTTPLSPGEGVDIIIRGGTIYDGSGKAGFLGDIALTGERIVAVGDLSTWSARQTISARGKIVCPGFIDLHTHCDSGLTSARHKENRNYLTQGVSTVVTGNCGGGKADTAAFFATLESQGVGTNVIHLLPHGTLRRKAMGGSYDRPPTAAELARMKALVAAGMTAGAWGMSTGLFYAPGAYSTTAEVVALAKVVAESGGIYASHIRSEEYEFLGALEESIEIGRRSGCPVQISHYKAAMVPNFGKVKAACALVEWARARGLKVTCDQYPYHASSTSLAAFTIPNWARVGGNKALFKRLGEPETAKRIKAMIGANLKDRGGPGKLLISSNKRNAAWNGKTLGYVARQLGKDPVEAILDLQRDAAPRAISFSMLAADVEFIMQKDYVATSSDGGCNRPFSTTKAGHKKPNPSRPHPRSYGAFPRKISHYARQKKVISLAHAIRAASGLPADILALKDRGYIKPGLVADVLVYDPGTYRDQATFVDPHQYATGVIWLFVNGKAAIAQGKPTRVLSGRPLRHGK